MVQLSDAPAIAPSKDRLRLLLTALLLTIAGTLLALLWLNRGADTSARIVTDCFQDAPCQIKALRRLVTKYDPAFALTILDELSVKDPIARQQSHTFAHEIGYATFDKYNSLSQRLTHCRDNAAGGCFHGVMMMYVSHNGRTDNKELAVVCDSLATSADTKKVFKDCLHGLGHGMLMARIMQKDGVPGFTELRSALDGCKAIQTVFGRYNCDRGVFMEYEIAATTPVFHYRWKPSYSKSNLQWPCDAVKSDEVAACYDYQGGVITSQTKDLRQAFKVCDQAPAAGQEHCAANIGRNQNAGGDVGDIKQLVQTCNQTINLPQKNACIGGAAGYYLYYSGNIAAAMQLCAATADRTKAACQQQMMAEAKDYEIPVASVTQAISEAGLSPLF